MFLTTRLALALVFALVAATAAAPAGATRWAFSGTISSVDPGVATVDPSIVPGAGFTGLLSYATPSGSAVGVGDAEYFFEELDRSRAVVLVTCSPLLASDEAAYISGQNIAINGANTVA
jgi:hypothetical protein